LWESSGSADIDLKVALGTMPVMDRIDLDVGVFARFWKEYKM
jgi:hypothetical protein